MMKSTAKPAECRLVEILKAHHKILMNFIGEWEHKRNETGAIAE